MKVSSKCKCNVKLNTTQIENTLRIEVAKEKVEIRLRRARE